MTGFDKIKHMDVIRLGTFSTVSINSAHNSTGKKLHSHDHRPPMSDDKDFSEVSGYGGADFTGDTNDHWRVEILNISPKNPFLKSISSKFKLVHVNSGKALFSHSVKLPEYGFGQQEVSAASRGREDLITWIVEANKHEESDLFKPKLAHF